MKINLFYPLILFVIINIRTFILMYQDKQTAINNSSRTGKGRIPEVALFYNALLFGFAGIYAGMLIFRHKTQKFYFKIGIPIIALMQIALYRLLLEELSEDHGVLFHFDVSFLSNLGS